MPDVRSLELVTAAITEVEGRVLVAKGAHYWKLPGAKVAPYTDRLIVLGGALRRKLGLSVAPFDTSMPLLTEVSATLGGVAFSASVHHIPEFEGLPVEMPATAYHETRWVNPLALGVGRLSLSPIAEEFFGRVAQNPELLIRPGEGVG